MSDTLKKLLLAAIDEEENGTYNKELAKFLNLEDSMQIENEAIKRKVTSKTLASFATTSYLLKKIAYNELQKTRDQMNNQVIDHLEDTTFTFNNEVYNLSYAEKLNAVGYKTPFPVVTDSNDNEVTRFKSKGSTHADLCYLEGFLVGYDDGYCHGNFEGDQRGFKRGFESN